MKTTVVTKCGPVTSYREAWKDEKRGNRSVWTWRTDGAEAHDFGSAEAAQKWIDEVNYLESQKDVDEAGWFVLETV